MPQTSEMFSVDSKNRANTSAVEKPYRAPDERIRDFQECFAGFSVAEAQEEASRCIHCPEPTACVMACPLHNDIPTALWHIEQGDFIKAAEIYRLTNPLPEACGRVCPDEASCATSCVLTTRLGPINTQALESFVADYQRVNVGVPLPEKAAATGKRVAVVGAGPAGLTVAEELTVLGHEVVVYDAMPEAGGLLMYGIPNFKLEKDIVSWKTDWLTALGVQFVLNTKIGEDILISELLDEASFDAVFLGTGTLVAAKMGTPGEDLCRVYDALQFLGQSSVGENVLPETDCEYTPIGNRVAVIGGGDSATDCMRTALRLGAEEVVCYYRRTEKEMPGNARERHHAEEEGAHIEYLTAPLAFLDRDNDGAVDAMQMVRMELGAPDSSGRRRPLPIEGSEYIVEVDDVVLAVGFWPDPLLGKTTDGLQTRKWGLIVADETTGATSLPGVYAGGDNVTGPRLVNEALAAGKRAAVAMHSFLSS
ncbi:MAG: NAD(P)-dependent oxidoreductase [Chloroflexi bacterium]|nr:NAD(P)-dependent oxidoreductase [Chloroflexota bacterium]